ncbi:MAG: hypothetical protein Q9157_007281 [Trypethelium eluteriae]
MTHLLTVTRPIEEDLLQKVKEYRNSLFLTDPDVDRERLKSTKGERVVGTCEWIIENVTYQSWLHGDNHLLWISGGPGKGKTMLSIFLTEELEKTNQNTRASEVIFYFCTAQDGKRNTTIAILRSLVYQIIGKRPELSSLVQPFFETSEKTRQTLLSFETLWIIFRNLVGDVNHGMIYCVRDGLDECDDSSVQSMIPKIINLFSPGSSHSTDNHFKLVIVSRDIHSLRGSAQVKLDPDNDEHVTSDIELFVSHKMQDLSSRIEGFADIQELVHKTLLERSEGTFLWVGFVVYELSQKCTRIQVLDALQELPKGLSAIYDRMLLQIESNERQASSRILQWVTMAVRPLTLLELVEATGVRSPPQISSKQVLCDEIDLCRPLLKVQAEEVGLVHESARDYLMRENHDRNEVLEEFRIKPENTHLELAKTCLGCVERNFQGPIGVKRDTTPLNGYATRYWPHHARSSSSLAMQLLHMSKSFFQKNSDIRKRWWEEYRGCEFVHGDLSFPPSPWPLACYLGIIPWAREIMRKRRWKHWGRNGVNKRIGGDCMALHLAAKRLEQPMVALLLHHGADIAAKTTLGETALHLAAKTWDESMAELLLHNGADIAAKTWSGDTALHLALEWGYEWMAELLLRHGADVAARTKSGKTALHYAAMSLLGAESKIMMLINHGADVNASTSSGSRALHYATFRGHEATVRLLLNHGADINAARSDGLTALHHAVFDGHKAVVKILLNYGADTNMSIFSGFTAIHCVAAKGHEATVRLLLDHGADVNTADSYGRTALHQAAFRGHEAVVKSLLDHGADANTSTSSGSTALHHAASGGHEATVRLLLDYRADVNASTSSGSTVLHHAASGGHEAIVPLLLDYGVDVNASNSFGETALYGAASGEHEAIVRLLLDHGAAVDEALFGAAFEGRKKVVQLLLEHGADIERDGSPALYGAARGGHKSVVRLLLDRGAVISAHERSARADDHWSKRGELRMHKEAMTLLRREGAT